MLLEAGFGNLVERLFLSAVPIPGLGKQLCCDFRALGDLVVSSLDGQSCDKK